MNTNMAGFRCFHKKTLHPCALDESCLSIGRVKMYDATFCVSAAIWWGDMLLPPNGKI